MSGYPANSILLPNTGILPPAWKQLYSLVIQQDPKALLAGGALRDLVVLGTEEPRDLDIFVRDGRVSKSELTSAWYSLQGRPAPEEMDFDIGSVDSESGPLDPTIVAEHRLDLPGLAAPVNLIEVDAKITPQKRFEQFDFGLCQIAYDGGPEFIVTDAFMTDYMAHTFTLLRAGENVKQSIRRFSRWTRYGWPMVIPAALDLSGIK